jgi:DNA-binding NarL/FixJ family response regulator
MGDLDRAVGHFEDSLVFCRKAGYRPELAWTCCDYADTLLQRNQPGDREQARSLMEESLAISTELGMRPLIERVQSRLEGLESSPSATPAYPDGLTQREVEVLNLIAQGKSNRGIGEELVISEGTVRRHVNNIYDKISVTNRSEATRYALERNLAEGQ